CISNTHCQVVSLTFDTQTDCLDELNSCDGNSLKIINVAVCIMTESIQFITDDQGKKISIVLSIERYNELLEDIEDLTIALERKHEDTIPFNDVKEELLND
ncbi:MAG: hypothetical protein ACC656_11505, partial [Candidatus Heimdallarchaeota archaeon]